MDDHTLDPNAGDIRRIEVISGTGRRRRWSAETKAQIIAESFAGEASVSEVARRHGLRPQQLFGWRHYARNGQLAVNSGDPPAFVPMITDGATALASCAAMAGSAIEIEVAGMIVRGACAAAATRSTIGVSYRQSPNFRGSAPIANTMGMVTCDGSFCSHPAFGCNIVFKSAS